MKCQNHWIYPRYQVVKSQWTKRSDPKLTHTSDNIVVQAIHSLRLMAYSKFARPECKTNSYSESKTYKRSFTRRDPNILIRIETMTVRRNLGIKILQKQNWSSSKSARKKTLDIRPGSQYNSISRKCCIGKYLYSPKLEIQCQRHLFRFQDSLK